MQKTSYIYNYKSFCTEINPTLEQQAIIEDYFNLCTNAFNLYIEFNKDISEKIKTSISPDTFLQLIRQGKYNDSIAKNFILPQNLEAVNKTLRNAEKAINDFLLGKSNYPSRKSMGTKHISLYFKAFKGKYFVQCERHRINVPYLGWIRIKEKGYIPISKSGRYVISGWIKKRAGRYYLSALVNDTHETPKIAETVPGIGIDLNLTNYATISDGRVYDNFNKGEKICSLQKRIKRITRSYNHVVKKRRTMVKNGTLDPSELFHGKNLLKKRHEIDRLHWQIQNIQSDHINKIVCEISKTPYAYISLEDLKVTELISERRFSKYISLQNYYHFRLMLHHKYKNSNTQIRIISQWYPSSKTCHNCGAYFRNLTLDDREFICFKCGSVIQRDLNAALNIRDCRDYYVWK